MELLQRALPQAPQLTLRHRADHLVDHFAALDQDQGRNAAHPVLTGGGGIFVDIDLAHLDLAVKGLGQFVDQRRDVL